MSRLSHIALAAAVAALFAGCGSSTPTPAPATASDATDTGTKTDATDATASDAADATASDTTAADAADTAQATGDTATGDAPKQDTTTPPKDTAPPSDKCAPDDSQCMQTYCFPQDVPGHCSKEVVECMGIDLKCQALYQCVLKCQSDPKWEGPELPKDVTPPSDPTQVTCTEKCVLKSGEEAAKKLAAVNKCVITKCIDCNLAANKQQCVGQCALVQCEDKLNDCNKDKDCSTTFSCLLKCGATDAKCQGACIEKATPKAQELLTAFNACTVQAQSKCQ